MQQGGAERAVWLALSGFIGLILVLGAVALWSGDGDEFPVMGTVPDFELIDSTGSEVTRADFDGRVWVADFIFTHCAGVCPILSAQMADIQKSLAERQLDVRLVSVSVDPARDTPEVLAEYADRFGADSARWTFLTGERDALYDLIGKGFLLSVSERSAEEAGGSDDLITHSDRFVLVDGDANIRGYYHGTDRGDVDRLIQDLEKIVR